MILNKKFIKCVALLCAAFVLMGGINVNAVFSSSYLDTGDVTVTVDTASEHKAISPYIYGISAETSLTGLSAKAIKQTSSRLSSYNWENNFSNSANGENSTNDSSLVSSYPVERQRHPALYTESLVASAKRNGIPSKYVTLQMMGLVAADGGGTVRESDVSRFDKVFFRKHDSLLSQPDTSDGAVYMDEYVSYLANRYGYAADGGINGYFLDNEPENWSRLYPFAATRPITADELIDRSAELSLAVKEIDPTALVYGPSVSGIEAFINLKNAGDWEQHAQEYSWFIDYYLMGMKSASDAAGIRLLDVLDVHYHTEATNGLLEPIISGTDNFSNNTRLQAPRILWDSSYTENSAAAIMHNQHIPLIPTLEASINMYYPGTKLSFSEYNFGGGGHISGGIAVADTLGIFAEHGVHMACLKPNSRDTSYQKSGINIYTNYDGNGGSFGNTLVEANNGGDVMSSAYASIDGSDETSLKLLLINKNQRGNKNAEIVIRSDAIFESADVYSFNAKSPDIVMSEESLSVNDNALDFEMEPLTVYMLVFDGSEEVITAEPPDETDEPEQSGTEEVTADDTGSGSVTGETASTQEHEHVPAETLSAASTPDTSESDTAPPETVLPSETSPPADTETTESAAAAAESGTDGTSGTDVPSVSAETESAESSSEDGKDGGDKKKVPAWVKAAVLILVAAVAAGMVYVIIQDKLLGKRSGK